MTRIAVSRCCKTTLSRLLTGMLQPAADAVRLDSADLRAWQREDLGRYLGYQGPKMAAAVARTGTWKIEIVRRCDRHKFVVLPKRWIVERTIGWISRNRRLARDFEMRRGAMPSSIGGTRPTSSCRRPWSK